MHLKSLFFLLMIAVLATSLSLAVACGGDDDDDDDDDAVGDDDDDDDDTSADDDDDDDDSASISEEQFDDCVTLYASCGHIGEDTAVAPCESLVSSLGSVNACVVEAFDALLECMDTCDVEEGVIDCTDPFAATVTEDCGVEIVT
ncbi:MAG: hypothetical protein H6685_07805 [Deltaproteobacteria bacterium]|nr:hypothetical protein [Deltaproteobacteria bacterium]